MSRIWTADVDLTVELARELLADAFPDLCVQTIDLLGIGWDNAAYLVNGDLVFRFPRRKLGGDLIANEIRWLPAIAKQLPAPIPAPIYSTLPGKKFPYPFAGYPFIHGVTADRANLSAEQRIALAVPFAKFLKALHNIPVSDADTAELPRDEIGRSNLPAKYLVLQQRMARSRDLFLRYGYSPEKLLELALELSTAARYQGPERLAHGDLYCRHLLVGETGDLTGVIDWGDLHLGDPALDLSIAYSFLPPEARDAFWQAYGQVDESALQRARFKALFYGEILLEYGIDVGDDALVEVGREALNLAIASNE